MRLLTSVSCRASATSRDLLAHGNTPTTMPPGPSNRPQTLKQAKKAYRKSGATVRLSDSELALIERRAVLQERADRIREREARRKANLQRKEERNQKEREVRQRMNLPSPTKGGFHVGPSQLQLGDFMVMGGKRKREEAPTMFRKIGDSGPLNTEPKSYQASPVSPQSRTPLQEASANTRTKVEPGEETDGSKQSGQDTKEPLEISTEVVPPNLSCYSLQVASTKSSALPSPLIGLEALKVEGKGGKAIHPDDPLPMGPPPLPRSSKTKSASPTTQQARSILASQGNTPEIALDIWDDVFVSNTQIAGEISLPALSRAPKSATPTAMPSSPSPPSENETTSLLFHLSTQDLEISDLFTQSLPAPNATTTTPPTPPKAASDSTMITATVSSLLLQISTQDLDLSSPSTPSEPQSLRKGSSEFNEDVTEEDLQDLVLEYEMQSSWGSKGQNKAAEEEGDREGISDGEAAGDGGKIYAFEDNTFESELSTQEWRDLGIECG